MVRWLERVRPEVGRAMEGKGQIMWKKEGVPDPSPVQRVEPMPTVGPVSDRIAQPRTSEERATIGRSITIRGEVTGDEDLLIQGRVEGSIRLEQHAITIGREGEVKADVAARVITVEGSVHGDLLAEEQVVLRSSAVVEGDISAPRVVLEDGARFRGGIDMGESLERGTRAGKAGGSATVRPAGGPQPLKDTANRAGPAEGTAKPAVPATS
jgi:cytoskeletal protein CcmA (bactofilin family)